MFPTPKGPSRILDIVDSLTVIPSFYTVDHACFGPLQMLIMSGQIDTSFDKEICITGSYSWGINEVDEMWLLEDEEFDDGVYFDGIFLADEEEMDLLLSEMTDG